MANDEILNIGRDQFIRHPCRSKMVIAEEAIQLSSSAITRSRDRGQSERKHPTDDRGHTDRPTLRDRERALRCVVPYHRGEESQKKGDKDDELQVRLLQRRRVKLRDARFGADVLSRDHDGNTSEMNHNACNGMNNGSSLQHEPLLNNIRLTFGQYDQSALFLVGASHNGPDWVAELDPILVR